MIQNDRIYVDAWVASTATSVEEGAEWMELPYLLSNFSPPKFFPTISGERQFSRNFAQTAAVLGGVNMTRPIES